MNVFICAHESVMVRCNRALIISITNLKYTHDIIIYSVSINAKNNPTNRA